MTAIATARARSFGEVVAELRAGGELVVQPRMGFADPARMRQGLLATRDARAATVGTITLDSYTRLGDHRGVRQALAAGADLNGYGTDVLSLSVPVISGPAHCPEIAISANGVRGMTRGAEQALVDLQRACAAVAHQVRLAPGTALLINKRKGLHARSQFFARHDGRDRWLQRTYLRRSLWTIRYRGVPGDRRVH